MQDKIADFMIEFEGVGHVLTAYSLTHNASSAGKEVLFQNAFLRNGAEIFCIPWYRPGFQP